MEEWAGGVGAGLMLVMESAGETRTMTVTIGSSPPGSSLEKFKTNTGFMPTKMTP